MRARPAWFKANHQGYAKMPRGFNSPRWNMEHIDLTNELVERLEERSGEIFVERQNEFRVESPRHENGSQRRDLIALHPDGRAIIYDARTVRESASHVAQVYPYMYLAWGLPLQLRIKWRLCVSAISMPRQRMPRGRWASMITSLTWLSYILVIEAV